MTTTEPQIDVIPRTPSQVAKSILYIALAAGGLLTTARQDQVVTLDEIVTIVILVVGLVPIYLVSGTLAKTLVAFALAALNALNVLFIGGVAGLGDVTLDDWILIGIQAFAAIGIAYVPNKPPAPIGTTTTAQPVIEVVPPTPA